MIYAIIDDNVVQTIISSTTKPEGAIEYPDSAEIYQGCDTRFFDDAGCRLSVDQAVGMELIDPVGENQTTVWEDGKYIIKSDYTGVPYWDKATGKSVRLSLGEEPDESMTDIKPPDPMAVWSETGWIVPDEVLTERVRLERDRLLSESDYIMMADYPLSDKTDWKTYRQALRDLPLQPGFPQEVSWPGKPAEITEKSDSIS